MDFIFNVLENVKEANVLLQSALCLGCRQFRSWLWR